MICWSCQKAAGENIFCAACGAILPPDRQQNCFQVLGIPPKFSQDTGALEKRYKDLTKLLHPDRYAQAGAEARRASLERSVQLNEAYRTLIDPVRRAEYLLKLHGIDAGDPKRAPGVEGGTGAQTVPIPQDLLMTILELREAFIDAKEKHDLAAMGRILDAAKARSEQLYGEISSGFSQPTPDYQKLTSPLISLRYYRRFLDEAQAQLKQLNVTAKEKARAS